jgi:hypothetical protein
MAKTVFFSWQSDTPTSVGRNFLRDILEKACADIASDTTVEESHRDLEVDSDTQGEAGQPPIVDTIFKKIDTASIFIGDLTFTGTRLDGHRPIPNPNVLIEYGRATKALESERIICIMNAAYGEPNHDTLPFNLIHRLWPITYNLLETATPEEKKKEKDRMIKIMKKAIHASLGTIPTIVEQEKTFVAVSPKNSPYQFRNSGEAIGFEDDNFRDTNKEVFLKDGPAMWFRLLPTIETKKKWSPHEIRELCQKNPDLLWPMRTRSGYSFVRAEDGEGVFEGITDKQGEGDSAIKDAWAISFVFETGEIWGVDVALLDYKKESIFYGDIVDIFTKTFNKYTQFLSTIEIPLPYKWIAGMTGLKGRKLKYSPPPGKMRIGDSGPICVTDTIEVNGIYTGNKDGLTVLSPFFDKIFEKCGRPRPDHLK